MRVLPLILIACLALSGCGSYFAPDRNVKRKLNESDVVGTWKLTSDSLATLQRRGYKPPPSVEHTIQFKADGTLLFTSAIESRSPNVTYLTSTGTWKLEHDTATGSNVVTANTIALNIRQGNLDYHTALYFTEDRGPLHLWDWCGDPDSWEFFEYERVPSSTTRP